MKFLLAIALAAATFVCVAARADTPLLTPALSARVCADDATLCDGWKLVGQPSRLIAEKPSPLEASLLLSLAADHERAYVLIRRGDYAGWAKNYGEPGADGLAVCEAATATCAEIYTAPDFRQKPFLISFAHDELVLGITHHVTSKLYDPEGHISYQRSTDGGRQWTEINVPARCETDHKHMCSLMVASNGDYVFVFAALNSEDESKASGLVINVYRSHDFGKNWTLQTPHGGLLTRSFMYSETAMAGNHVVLILNSEKERSLAVLDEHGKLSKLGMADKLDQGKSLIMAPDSFIATDANAAYLLGRGSEPSHYLYRLRENAEKIEVAAIGKVNGRVTLVTGADPFIALRAWYYRDPGEAMFAILHVSQDGGDHWQAHPLPNDKANGDLALRGGRLWSVSGGRVYYMDIKKP
ncbi:MAG: glycoside hydrolase [Methylobacillus sp.]|jgi:hypothetical protein|nr:glycoside hydrolase [Methylobacillus sp.]